MSFSSIWFRIGAPAASALWPLCRTIGTWSPIWSFAVRLSSTVMFGEDRTCTVVMPCRAFSTTLKFEPLIR